MKHAIEHSAHFVVNRRVPTKQSDAGGGGA